MSEPKRQKYPSDDEPMVRSIDQRNARIARLEGALRQIIGSNGELLPSDATTARQVIAIAQAALDDKDTPA